MRKIILILSLFTFLVGCTNSQEEKTAVEDNNKENISLQEKIENVMTEKGLKYREIIDFDIVDDFIFSVSLNHNGGLDLSMIKYENGELEWIAGGNDATILGLDESTSPFAYLIQPNESNVKQVNVFNEPAKKVVYFDGKTDDYTREINYWIAYTEKDPSSAVVEYIKE